MVIASLSNAVWRSVEIATSSVVCSGACSGVCACARTRPEQAKANKQPACNQRRVGLETGGQRRVGNGIGCVTEVLYTLCMTMARTCRQKLGQGSTRTEASGPLFRPNVRINSRLSQCVG